MFVLLFWVTVVAVVLLFARWIVKIKLLKKQLAWIPGPPTRFFFGNALQLLGLSHSEIFNLLCEWSEKYGEILIIWICFQPMIIVSGPEWIKILTNTTKGSKKSIQYDFLDDFIGKSLLSSHGEDWFHRRKILTPCFHFEILNNFVQSMENHSKRLVSVLRDKCNSAKPFQVDRLTKLTALDIVMETTMGVTVNALDSPENSYVQAIDTMNSLIIIRSFVMFLENDYIYSLTKYKRLQDKCKKELKTFSSEIIRKRKEVKKNEVNMNDRTVTDKNRFALLDLLINLQEKGADLNDQQIEEEINTFIFAGHDTTAAAMSFILYCLGRHPLIQERAAAEVRSVLPKLMSECPTLKDLGQLEYLDRCIKECLRIYPPVPTVGKILLKPLVTEKGTIPAGVNMALDFYNLHKLEELFKNCNHFDPDRFLKNEEEQLNPFAYLPFSAGPRNCIGQRFAWMEMKMVISHILYNFKVEALDKPEDLKLMSHIVLKCEAGIRLLLTERK